MAKFLIWFLVITGVGAAVVIAEPVLVVLGLFALYVPGALMSLLPTAFVWASIFAIAWYYLRGLTKAIDPAIASFFATVVILLLVPLPALLVSKWRIAANAQQDVIPAERIKLTGDIRLDFASPRQDHRRVARLPRNIQPYACDMVCIALLLAPDVRTVTIKRSQPPRDAVQADFLDKRARTYRLVSKTECAAGTAADENPWAGGSLLGQSAQDRERAKALLLAKLSSNYCLASEQPINHIDFRIREVRKTVPDGPWPGRWSLVPSPASVKSFVIDDDTGQVLARINRVKARSLQHPLWVELGGGLSGPRFQWARRWISDGRTPDDPPVMESGTADFTTLPSELAP